MHSSSIDNILEQDYKPLPKDLTKEGIDFSFSIRGIRNTPHDFTKDKQADLAWLQRACAPPKQAYHWLKDRYETVKTYFSTHRTST